MSRDIEAQQFLFMGELFRARPVFDGVFCFPTIFGGGGRSEVRKGVEERYLAAGPVFLNRGCCADGWLDGGKEGRAMTSVPVKSTAFDETLKDFLVYRAGV